MKVKNIIEKNERTFTINYTNEEGEEDNEDVEFRISEKYNEWMADLKDKYSIEELKIIIKILDDLNNEKRDLKEISNETKLEKVEREVNKEYKKLMRSE